jgi:hypothetical protein
MGWDKGGRYYTRSRRVNGRVVREHVGGGFLGFFAAQLDAAEREKRLSERTAARAEREELAALDAPLHDLDEVADLFVREALLAAGYRQHNRGEWRKRRDDREQVE